MLAKRHRDSPQLLFGGAIEQLMALEKQRVQRALRGEAPGRVVEVGGNAAARHARAAVSGIHRALRVAIHQGHRRAQTAVDRHGSFDNALRSIAAAAPARIQAPQLARALTRQRGPGAQAVDVILFEPRIVERALQCARGQRIRVVARLAFGHRSAAGAAVVSAVIGFSHADDGHGVLQRRQALPIKDVGHDLSSLNHPTFAEPVYFCGAHPQQFAVHVLVVFRQQRRASMHKRRRARQLGWIAFIRALAQLRMLDDREHLAVL